MSIVVCIVVYDVVMFGDKFRYWSGHVIHQARRSSQFWYFFSADAISWTLV